MPDEAIVTQPRMITRLDDLSNDQLLALTPEETQRWIDVECAFEKVPLLPPSPVPPTPVSFEPDLLWYEVGEWVFSSASDAAKVLDILRGMEPHTTEYVSGPSYDRTVGRVADVKVEPKRLFSPERWQAIAVRAAQATTDENAYNADKREWDKIAKTRERIVDYVTGKIEKAHQVARQKAETERLFARYLDLAGGDADVARRFMLDARPDANTTAPELFSDGLDIL